MKSLWLLFICLTLIYGENIKSNNNQARYDNYRVYYVELETEEHVKIFQKIEERSDSYTFYGHARHPNQKLTIMVAAHKIAELTDLLETYKVKHEILTYNFQEKIDNEMKDIKPITTPANEYDWDHYFHLETIYAWLEKLANDYEFITLIDMGESLEGIPIKGVKFAKNPNNPGIFIESGIHAREWIAPATATYILNELLSTTNSLSRKLATNFNWFIFPIINPDGYKYSFEMDRMWRKNRNLYETCRGVDLNRNFPYHWNETGSNSDPCSYDFAGNFGGSEPETIKLMKYIQDHVISDNIKTYLSLHSYSQLIMFPYSHTPEKVQNYDDLKLIGEKATAIIEEVSGKKYISGSIYETIYPSSGGSKDWAYGVFKIPITFTFELRGMPNSTDLFILPANEIRGTGEEIYHAISTILNESDKLGYFNSTV